VYQESEIVQLILVAFLTPMLWIGVRTVHIFGRKRFIAAYWVMVCGYLFTVAEGYVAADLMNTLEHLSYAVSGALLAYAMYAFMRDARQQAEAS